MGGHTPKGLVSVPSLFRIIATGGILSAKLVVMMTVMGQARVSPDCETLKKMRLLQSTGPGDGWLQTCWVCRECSGWYLPRKYHHACNL